MKFILLSIALSNLVAGKINVCRKRNYDRGVGKVRWRCREGESRRAGLCYTNCKDGYGELVTRCIMQCKDQYPVKCGLEFCAATKGDCAKIVSVISAGAIGGFILGNVGSPLLATSSLSVVLASQIGVGAALGQHGAKQNSDICPW